MKFVRVLLTSAIAFAGVAGAAPMPAEQAAKIFGARPDAYAADLSPLGDKMVYLSAGKNSQTIVYVFDINTEKVTRVIASNGRPDSLQWCEFATQTMLICNYGGNGHVQDVIAYFSRLVAIDLNTAKLKPLGVPQSYNDAAIHQSDGQILDWLPDEASGAVLMARNYTPQRGETGSHVAVETRGGTAVDRIDLNTMRSTTVEVPKLNVSRYLTDGRGNVRIVGYDKQDGNDQLTGKTVYRYRAAGSRDWRDLGVFDSRSDTGMWPLAVDQARDAVYFLQKTNGRDALYRQKLDIGGTPELIAKNDKVDIGGVIRIARGSPIVGYTYNDERERTVYFDQDYKSLAAALSRALPNSPLIEFAGASRDGNKLLLRASADQDPGGYYVLDRRTKQMKVLLASRSDLEGVKLAPVKSITIPAADGTPLPAYLTMSADGPATDRPAIVLPHGGPSSRDEWGFDWLTQYLASRGYAVIQPQYRGSAGYGEDFMGDNAFRGWSTAMSDIRDAAKYLVAKGIADPKRMAIVGWSYGGYAALQSAATDPARYKAVVAIAPVTDLSALRGDAEGFSNADLTRDFIGKGPNLQAGSPLHHAAAIKVPVLLAHGDLDANVRIAHSLRMEAALRRNGTPVELLRYKDLEHQLDDSDARAELLTHIGALLEKTIGH